MTPDINKLKLCVARMLPDHIHFYAAPVYGNAGKLLGTTLVPKWADTHTPVTDREWLHICWLAEETLSAPGELEAYNDAMLNNGNPARSLHELMEGKLKALCRVKYPEMFTPSSSASQTPESGSCPPPEALPACPPSP